jgi:hypothetical protein
MAVKPYLDKYTVTKKNKVNYPSPFFDISSTYIPKTVKTLFKYCKTFFYKNSFLNSVITKMAEYPITDFIYDKAADDKVKKLYNQFLYKQAGIKSLLVNIGLDYYTYGNAFISVNFKFDRYLICDSCEHENQYDEVKGIKLQKYDFHGTCSKCSASTSFKIKDKYLKKPEYMNFIRWAPENIDIDYDPLTGTSIYYYTMPNNIKKKINSVDIKYLKTVPKVFLESLKHKKKIQMDPENFYHFKKNTLAEEDMGFGKPAILPVLGDIWYMQTLRKGNEAIAAEHIVPFRTLYPSSVTGDPFTSTNMGKWKARVQEEVRKWQEDPNHIAIFPIPLGIKNMGGDAKLLLATQELRFQEEVIINAFGIPVEFIKGGASWSGSSISLRIVENHFLHYRSMLEDFMNYFVIGKAVKMLEFPQTSVVFKRLRMADDSETKRIMLDLEANDKISHSRLLEEFGINYQDEIQNIIDCNDNETQIMITSAIKKAKAQVKTEEIVQIGQIKIQNAVQEEMAKIREAKFEADLSKEIYKNYKTEMNPHSLISAFAEQVMIQPLEERDGIINEIGKNMPLVSQMVLKRIQEKILNDPAVQAEYTPTEEEQSQTSKTPTGKQTNKEEKQKLAPKKSGDVQ